MTEQKNDPLANALGLTSTPAVNPPASPPTQAPPRVTDPHEPTPQQQQAGEGQLATPPAGGKGIQRDEDELEEEDTPRDPTATKMKVNVTISATEQVELDANDYAGLDPHCTPAELLARAQQEVADGDLDWILDDLDPASVTITAAGHNMTASGIVPGR